MWRNEEITLVVVADDEQKRCRWHMRTSSKLGSVPQKVGGRRGNSTEVAAAAGQARHDKVRNYGQNSRRVRENHDFLAY